MIRYFLNLLLVFGFLLPGVRVQNTVEPPNENVYIDDFESLRSDRELRQSYTAWEDGALVEVSLTQDIFHSGEKAMRVEMQGINPTNQSANGSIYHTMNSWQNNWTGGEGLRFWIRNESDGPLVLNFNFKEKYNEYWAVAQQGVFYFEDDNGNLVQQDIYYSNLLIPVGYEGNVIVPFSSFAVPEWNTARGDEIMQLNRIESYALGMSLGESLPQVFYVDDIEVISRDDYPRLSLFGEEWVSAPASGELGVFYTAQVRLPGDELLSDAVVDWTCADVLPAGLSFSPEGKLTVPAGADNQTLTLTAVYDSDGITLTNAKTIHILGAEPQAEEPLEPTPTLYVTPIPTDYQQFSSDFEKWTTENRTLFVILLVGGIVIILAVLSALQRRLK